MKRIENEIWLEVEEVVSACNVTDRAIQLGVERGSAVWQTIKDPSDKRRTLIRYSTLSFKYKEAIKTLTDGLEPSDFINLNSTSSTKSEGLGLAQKLTDAFEHDFVQFLNLYRPDTEDQAKRQRQKRDLARAAAFIVALAKHYEETNTPLSKYVFYTEASEWLQNKANIRAYGRQNNSNSKLSISYLPTHPTRLAEKVKEFAINKKPIVEVITQPRTNNENRMGENHTFAKGAVARLMTEGKNPTDAEMIRKVQYLCNKEGLKEPSESTIRRMVADLQSLAALKRYGESNKAAHKYRHSTPLARAMYAGDCWEMDGTRVQLQPHIVEGKFTYLYVVAIRDVYSGAYVGWSFGVNESGMMYREALRMAVTLTGYLPCELKYDRFPGHDSDEINNLFNLLKERGVRLSKTSSSTGKAAAERSFGTLQSVFEMDRKEWIGQGIKSSRHYNRPTQEYLMSVQKSLKNQGYTWEEAWRTENEVILLYNYTPLNLYSKKYKNIAQSPIELHDTEAARKNIIRVEVYEIAELFWATRKVQIANYKVTIKVNKTEYIFDLVGAEYYNITRNYKNVLVRYDASDMSEVMLFDPITNEPLATIKPFEPIQIFGNSPEYGRLQERKTKVKQQKKLAKEELQSITDNCKADVLTISLAGMLSKEAVEQAETSAMGKYWTNVVPVKPNNPTAKPTPAKKVLTEVGSPEIDSMTYILNQL